MRTHTPPAVECWADLLRIEPALRDLDYAAAQHHYPWPTLTASLRRLVGFRSPVPELRTPAACAIAYDRLAAQWDTYDPTEGF
jgi:hypothetical protein